MSHDSLNNVKCVVEDCRYNHQKHCHASAIEVAVDDGSAQAGMSEQTQCRTYEKR